jgi:hypothetical protein
VPGPPSGTENYVVCISFPGPLNDSQIKKLNAEIKKCIKHLKKILEGATVQQQKIEPKH